MTSSTDPEVVKFYAPFQAYALFLARVLAVIAFILTINWAISDNTDDKYLGGLDWNKNVFNWHPVLMIFSMLVCLVQGVVAYRKVKLSHETNKILHGLWYIAGLIFASVGLKAVWKSHDHPYHADGAKQTHIANLYSLHSWIGLAVVLLFCQNLIFGGLHYFNPYLAIELKKRYMPSHKVLGFATFGLAVAAILSGIVEKNTFLGCSYPAHTVDGNPASNYHEIPPGCRLSNGIGMVVICVFLLVCFGMLNFDQLATEKVGGTSSPLQNSLMANQHNPMA